MHFGNLSFYADDLNRDVARPTLRLAPVYDMLPMMWRPNVQSGELNLRLPEVPPVNASHAREQAEAREWAFSFWQQAATLGAIDEPLRDACEVSAIRLRAK